MQLAELHDARAILVELPEKLIQLMQLPFLLQGVHVARMGSPLPLLEPPDASSFPQRIYSRIQPRLPLHLIVLVEMRDLLLYRDTSGEK